MAVVQPRSTFEPHPALRFRQSHADTNLNDPAARISPHHPEATMLQPGQFNLERQALADTLRQIIPLGKLNAKLDTLTAGTAFTAGLSLISYGLLSKDKLACGLGVGICVAGLNFLRIANKQTEFNQERERLLLSLALTSTE